MGYTQKPVPSLSIKKAKGKIIVDGKLDDVDWQSAQVADQFFQQFPSDTSYSITTTEVKVTFDDNFLYVGAICHDTLKGKYVIQSLKRDFSYPISDAFAVFIDPFDDKTNGFSFAVNPMGVQREGLLQNGGGFGVTTNWDNKWFSKVIRHEDKWVVEMAIPFKTLRYKEGITKWGINFSRNDLKRNENSSWASVPQNFNIASLAFFGQLNWEEPPKKAGANVAIIPYGISGHSSDFVNDTSSFTYGAGMDAKIALTSSLNLDLTFNPDFSQVDADVQQTNLTRFSLFFPERRQFFIENSDLFARFGFRQIRPFFSRRIGLSRGNSIPILGGIRLSGKVNKDWRIGIMNLQTSKKEFINDGDTTNIFSQNYTVAAFQRTVFTRSNISGIVVNRQEFNPSSNAQDYNRVVGADYNIASKNNKWQGKLFYHQSFSPNVAPQKANANASWLMYDSKELFVMWNHEYVGRDYNAEVGFVPRNRRYNPELNAVEKLAYWRLEPSIEYKMYPSSSIINTHSPTLYLDLYADSSFATTDRLIRSQYKIKFQNTSLLTLQYNEIQTRLLFDTDVTFSGNSLIPKGIYRYRNGYIAYTSDKRKTINGSVNINYGSYYVGQRFTLNGALAVRKQPWGILSMNFSYNDIRLPSPYQNATIALLGPKLELSFTKNVFFTTFVQYNSQIENFNINSRLQWRFRPMSDLFIVYTDNYQTATETHYNDYFTSFSPQINSKKNRAIVIKFVYWLGL